MLDATRGIESQDMNIFQLIQRNNKSLVVVVNKWDLVQDKTQKVIDTFENAIRSRMAPFVDFPIIFASALTKQRIFKVLETAKQVYQNRTMHIGTTKLNEVMLPIIEATPPQSVKGKYIKIKYCSQLPNTQIPSFVFYANLPQYVKEQYRRFLENKIRENWNLMVVQSMCLFVRSSRRRNINETSSVFFSSCFIMLVLACSKKKDEIDHGRLAGQAAKHYYEQLLKGKYDAFLNGEIV